MLTWLLLLTWLGLMTFGLISVINPQWLQDWSQAGRRSEVIAYKQYGDSFLRRKEYGKAIAQYQKALDIDPQRVNVMTNMAVAYREGGNTDKAAQILTAAMRLPVGRKGPLYFNCGVLLEQQGKTDEALGYYQKAVGTTVDQSLVFGRLGLLYTKANRFEEARGAFEKMLACQVDVTRPYREMLVRSLEYYEDDTVNLPIIERLFAAKTSETDLARYDLEIIRQLQRRDQNIAKTYNHLGFVSIQLKDNAAAVAYFRKSLEIWPGNLDASRALALLTAPTGTAGATQK